MTRRAVVYLNFPDEADVAGLALADRYAIADPEFAAHLEGLGMPAGPAPLAVKAAGDLLDLADNITIDYAVVDVERWRLEVGLTGAGLPRVAEHRPGDERWIVADWDPLIRLRTPPTS